MTGFKPSTGKLRTATFKVIALLLPLVFLLLLEGALRFFGYGENLSIFIDQPGQKDYLILNPRVSDRYFGHSDNATQGNQEPFAKQKRKAHSGFSYWANPPQLVIPTCITEPFIAGSATA